MVSYKLVTYQAGQGARAGIVVNEQVHDAAGLAGNPSYATMLGILNDWPAAQKILEQGSAKSASGGAKGLPVDEATLLAPVLYPSVVFCAGSNYVDHKLEMAGFRKMSAEPDPKAVGLLPWHFIKASRAIVGPGAVVPLPAYSKKVDWEAELAAVIGRPAKNVSPERALDYVAGYTIANDLSARDASKRPHLEDGSPFQYDWVGQKCFDGACPVGPWIVPAGEIGDPQNLGIRLWVNDVLKQDSNTGKMIFSLAEQIAHLTTRITLYPGDLILTGTPSGVGASRQEFLKPGDVVKIWIEKIGTLTNKMA
jgi:2-keto-4-pentenoate hydratase/2-oxohepta-3-ene-1,7-dioic acid hydratase in catechol pathway